MSNVQVSVVMASYNHAEYVLSSIQSVLKQKNIEFEFLIEDDGSSDATVSLVSEIKDSRVKFSHRAFNIGACATVNNMLARAKGKYIAVINSDDVWIGDDKLARQYEFLENNAHIDACFGRAQYIDVKGCVMNKENILYGNIFDIPNMSQSQWLRHFFTYGNCLCHPTAMIRKTSFDKIGLYDNRLRQIPDLRHWINLIKSGGIYIFDDVFIQFRLVEGKNTSSATLDNSTRLFNEYSFVYEDFFENVSPDLVLEGFSDILINKNFKTSIHQEIEQALLFFTIKNWIDPVMLVIGFRKIYELLGNQSAKYILKNEYGIDDLWFQRKMSSFSPYIRTQPTEKLENMFDEKNIVLNSKIDDKRKGFLKKIPILRYFSG